MTWDRKYTPEQKEAVVSAFLDRGIAPAARVVELAAAGKLTTPKGDKLAPFDFSEQTLRSYVKEERKKRLGKKPSALLDMPHRDAIEHQRRRFLAVTDSMLRDIEAKVAKNPANGDVKRTRDLVGLTRDIAALPDRKEPQPKAPSQRHNGEREPKPADTQLRRDLLAAIAEGEAAPNAPTQQQTKHGDNATSELARTQDEGATDDEGAWPGSLAYRLGAALNGRA